MSCWFEDIKKLTLDILPASAAPRRHENPLMNAAALHSDMNLPPRREKSHLNIHICIRNHMICFNVRINSNSFCQRKRLGDILFHASGVRFPLNAAMAAKGFFNKNKKAALIPPPIEFHIQPKQKGWQISQHFPAASVSKAHVHETLSLPISFARTVNPLVTGCCVDYWSS